MNSFLIDIKQELKEYMQDISGIEADIDKEGEDWFYSTLGLSYAVGLNVGLIVMVLLFMIMGWKL